MNRPSLATSQVLALAGGALAILGGVLPWASIGGATIPGYYDDGFIAVMAGVSVVGVVLVRPWTLLSWLAVAVFGGLAVVVNANATVVLLGPNTGVGPGLLAQLGGGALAVAGGAYATVDAVDDGGRAEPVEPPI